MSFKNGASQSDATTEELRVFEAGAVDPVVVHYQDPFHAGISSSTASTRASTAALPVGTPSVS